MQMQPHTKQQEACKQAASLYDKSTANYIKKNVNNQQAPSKEATAIRWKFIWKLAWQAEALFRWAFGFGFWSQKPKAQSKGLFLEDAFSEAAAFL